MEELMRLSPEQILLRWINFQLERVSVVVVIGAVVVVVAVIVL